MTESALRASSFEGRNGAPPQQSASLALATQSHEPVIQRCRTEKFKDLRDKCRVFRHKQVGPRWARLDRITAAGDAQELAQFLEEGRAAGKASPEPMQEYEWNEWTDTGLRVLRKTGIRELEEEMFTVTPKAVEVLKEHGYHIQNEWVKIKESCCGCHVKLAFGGQSVFRRRSSNGLTNALSGQDPKPLKACHVCRRWFCESCRSCSYDLHLCAPPGAGLPSQIPPSSPSLLPQLMRASSPSRSPTGTPAKCCEACHRFSDSLRWRRHKPPAGLSPSAGLLFTEHRSLARAHTQLVAALAQLEGLSRIEGLHGNLGQEVPDELREALQSSFSAARFAVEEAKNSMQAALRMIAEVPCPSPPHRDVRVRQGIEKYARSKLEVLNPKVTTAITRLKAQQLKAQAPDMLAGSALARSFCG